ncbi:hypothetical protein [Aeromicrobium sp. UC242_57]|uniref:hypothetical protein n=1 Tax=Aeromicrobium sp. UC242_57 TaxID=3374624 RepID=UPI0037903FB0
MEAHHAAACSAGVAEARRCRRVGPGRLVELQARDTGQIKEHIATEEIDQGVDQLRFFAGAARLLEGKATGSTSRDSSRASGANPSASSRR